MMKALITGATGFVGSHVARALADAGHEVRVLHRASSKLDALEGVRYESAMGDILDEDAVRAACHDCDRVFHVAAVSDYWRADKAKMFDANVRGTQLVLRAAREAGVQRVVFTSSAAAVGTRTDGSPANEQDTFNLPPERFPYGYSKALAERVVGEAVAGGQDVVIVNPVVVLGPGDLNVISGDFVLKTRRLRWTLPVPPGGVAVTDVRDVAHWHVAAAERGRTGERYILATENFAYHRWFALIAEVVGVRAPAFPLPRFALPLVAAAIDAGRSLGLALPVDANQVRLGAKRIYFQSAKTWAELGAPQVTMRQSLVDTYNWYRSHGYVQEDWLAQMIATFG
ncbi:MAG: NAD-dependent epimerase/dehydratase family protein [Chloroflexota bacterium]|nr:NAD-dependent epimerase/dehydratase family protein [Chloroflexota bacterium]